MQMINHLKGIHFVRFVIIGFLILMNYGGILERIITSVISVMLMENIFILGEFIFRDKIGQILTS